MYVVKKPFNTPGRRFVTGAKVAADDLAGPVPIDHWRDGGFIEPEKVEKPPKGGKPTAEAAA